MTGELRRSVLLSPRKYRNRIIYPKLFERTYCVFIDPASFITVEESLGKTKTESVDEITYLFDEDASLLGLFDDPKDEYTKYYVTLKLHPHLDDLSYVYTSISDEEAPYHYELAPDFEKSGPVLKDYEKKAGADLNIKKF